MCNEAARRTALDLMREDFSQLKITLRFPEELPNLSEAPHIQITDTTVIVRAAADDFEMVQRRWSWVGSASARGAGKPVNNFRSGGRRFGEVGRSMLLATPYMPHLLPRHLLSPTPPLSAQPTPPQS